VPLFAKQRIERRLAAILAADVAGYSRLMEADEEDTIERLKAHRRELIDPTISEHRGRIVKTTGDGLLIEFPSIIEAVSCATALQRGMVERNGGVPEGQRITFRIGVNLGDIIVEDGDIHGEGVNIAARLEGIAEPGGICISEDAFRQVRGKIDAEFDDIGEQSLKNITRPLRVYRVREALNHPFATAPGSPLSRMAGEGAERQRREAGEGSLPLPDKPSLAVLPFQNLTGDAEQEYFVDGMVEEITTAIARLPWLFVIARNSSFTYKGRSVDVKRVAQELGVRYVLEGSVRKAGNRVRITGQLIDTATGAHIWADRFDGTLDDIFDLQDQVASNVAGAIEPKLRQSEIERAGRKPTASLTAYDLYLRALALRYRYTEESMREALELLERALAIDPSYAPAAALVGSCRQHQRSHGLGEVSDAELSEAVRLARKAIEAGKDDPDVLWMAASTLYFFTGEYATAANVVDRALALNPNSAHAWMVRGMLLNSQSQLDRAIEALQHAMRLSPLDPLGARAFTMVTAAAHFAAGRYELAIEWADRALAAQPDYRIAFRLKASALAHLSRIEEAHDCLKRMLDLEPGSTVARVKAFAPPFPPELLNRYVEGLRKAGLPEE
jgi:adenylate cyclase